MGEKQRNETLMRNPRIRPGWAPRFPAPERRFASPRAAQSAPPVFETVVIEAGEAGGIEKALERARALFTRQAGNL